MRKEITIDGDFEAYIINERLSSPDVFAVCLQGSRMTTLKDLYYQLQAGLQLPGYFGLNWNAFEECINDLDWIYQKKYLIAIPDYEKILSECGFSKKEKEEELFNFEDVLKCAVKNWNGKLKVLIQESNHIYELQPDADE